MRRLIIFLPFIIFGCTRGVDSTMSVEGYQSWMSQNISQIAKTKQTSIMNIEALYLPPSYQAYQDITTSGGELIQSSLDSLSSEYGCSMTFQITLNAHSKETNLLYYRVRDYKDYKRRVNSLNFNIESFISLTINDNDYKPVISHFEGYHELSNKLVFHVAFKPQEYQCEKFVDNTDKIRLTFEDLYWESGTNHFTFKREHLEQLPQIALLN